MIKSFFLNLNLLKKLKKQYELEQNITNTYKNSIQVVRL